MAMDSKKAVSILETGAGVQWDSELVEIWIHILKHEGKI